MSMYRIVSRNDVSGASVAARALRQNIFGLEFVLVLVKAPTAYRHFVRVHCLGAALSGSE